MELKCIENEIKQLKSMKDLSKFLEKTGNQETSGLSILWSMQSQLFVIVNIQLFYLVLGMKSKLLGESWWVNVSQWKSIQTLVLIHKMSISIK